MKTKLSLLATCLVFLLTTSVQAVETIPLGSQKMKMPPIKTKANLVIHAVGWNHENCLSTCLQVQRDLKINKAGCGIKVRVANEGNKATGVFSVQLLYTHWKGTTVVQKIKHLGTGLKAKNQGQWVKDIVFNDIGYYRVDKPFIVTVDFGNKVPESNESDNKKSIILK